MHNIVEDVKRSLTEQSTSLVWRRVTMPGLTTPWVGMNVPSVNTGGRPWVWEVVTPEQYHGSQRLQDDELVLSVPHDVVLADIQHTDHAGPVMRMQVPVTITPREVVMPRGATQHHPWSVSLSTGWSVQALGDAAQCWIDRVVPGTTRLDTPTTPQNTPNLYQLHPAINIESAALDHLLTLGLDDAATVTSLLTTVHEALHPYR